MRRILGMAMAMAVAASIVTAPAVQAAPTIKKYASCRQLLKDFPHGLARDATASFALYSTGWYRPKVMHRTYLANRRLDTDHNGVLCEQRP